MTPQRRKKFEPAIRGIPIMNLIWVPNVLRQFHWFFEPLTFQSEPKIFRHNVNYCEKVKRGNLKKWNLILEKKSVRSNLRWRFSSLSFFFFCCCYCSLQLKQLSTFITPKLVNMEQRERERERKTMNKWHIEKRERRRNSRENYTKRWRKK